MVIVVVVMRVMGIVLLMGTIPLCSTRASMSPCAPKHLGVYLFGVPIVATASILLAQAMDAPDALTCRRHRLDELLPRRRGRARRSAAPHGRGRFAE